MCWQWWSQAESHRLRGYLLSLEHDVRRTAMEQDLCCVLVKGGRWEVHRSSVCHSQRRPQRWSRGEHQPQTVEEFKHPSFDDPFT
jgi:hypothetical protein